MEAQYVRNKFYIVKTAAPGGCKLRCVYCESDTDRFIVASKKNKWYTDDPAPLLRTTEQHRKDLIVFAEQTDALAGGFHFRRNVALYQEAELHRLRGEFSKAEEGYRQTSEWGLSAHPGFALLRLIQGRLGWRPKVALREGLRRTLEFYREEKEHYW